MGTGAAAVPESALWFKLRQHALHLVPGTLRLHFHHCSSRPVPSLRCAEVQLMHTLLGSRRWRKHRTSHGSVPQHADGEASCLE